MCERVLDVCVKGRKGRRVSGAYLNYIFNPSKEEGNSNVLLFVVVDYMVEGFIVILV